MNRDDLTAENLVKCYRVNDRRVEALRGLNLTVPLGRITAVVGRSGCGKTTLLRLLGGLEQPDEGRVCGLGDKRVAFVFQEPRLMPWLTVRGNIAFARPDMPREEIARLTNAVGLNGFERARPAQLSGGMAQRCALARALAYQPDYLLMDEPFAALDAFTRAAMQKMLVDIHIATGVGALLVTHSIQEALNVASSVLVMGDGRIVSEYASRAQGDDALLREQILKDIEA